MIYHDIDISPEQEKRIVALLQEAFASYDYPLRSYYKQRPHLRYIYEQDDQVIGYVGLDYRAMVIDGNVHQVLGLIDVAVKTDFREQGIATYMLEAITGYAKTRNVSCLLLFADNPALYLKSGFKSCDAEVTLFMIDEHQSLGIKTDRYPEVMIKWLIADQTAGHQIDLLGYLY